MNKIKLFIKNRFLYQYVRHFPMEVNKYKMEHKKNFIYSVISTAKKYRVIVNNNDKMNQYEKMVSHMIRHFKEDSKERFIYDIDTFCLFANKQSVIGNMPVNYEKVVNYSIEALGDSYGSNLVAKHNKQLLKLMSVYLNGILKKMKNPRHIQLVYNALSLPASNLEDALQRLLFWNGWLWQTGHIHNGLGRLDMILWNSYQKGQDEGEDAKAVIKDFLNTLHDYYTFKSKMFKGDTGQIIILGGNQIDQGYYCNKLTYLFLECLKELQLPDPKIMLRVGNNTPKSLIELAADCIGSGLGSPILSNDEIVVSALKRFGYKEMDAYNYVVSACWEPLSYGNSLEQNNLGSIEYAKILNEALSVAKSQTINSFDELVKICDKKLKNHLMILMRNLLEIKWEDDPLLSFFIQSCEEKGCDISKGGANYNNYGVTSVGMGNLVNSLINIKNIVFEQKIIKLNDVVEALEHNYQGYFEIKKIFQNGELCFGMNNPEVLEITSHFMEVTENQLKHFRNRFGGKLKFGLSSPYYISSAASITATADGRNDGKPLEVHISCKKGIAFTDLILFASKLDYGGIKSNGNVVDLVVQRDLIEKHPKQFQNFISSSVEIGFFQMQFNVTSYETLLDAQKHPERHQNLIVRVWGFSAYFNDLPKEYQDVLIQRAALAKI